MQRGEREEDILDVSFSSSTISSTSSSSFHSVDENKATDSYFSGDFVANEDKKRVVIHETIECEEDDIEEISDEHLGSFRGESCESALSLHSLVKSPPTKLWQTTSQAYNEPQPATHLEESSAVRIVTPRRRNIATDTVRRSTSQCDSAVSSRPDYMPSPRARLPRVVGRSTTSSPGQDGWSPRTSPRVHQYETESSSSLRPVNQAEALAHRATVSEASIRMLETYHKVKHNTRQRILRMFYDRWLLFLRKPKPMATVGTQTRARLHRRTARADNVDVEVLETKCLSPSSSDDWDIKRTAILDRKRTEEEEEKRKREQEEKEEKERRERNRIEKEAREQREKEEKVRQEKEKERERLSSMQAASSSASFLSPSSHDFVPLTASPPPTEKITVNSIKEKREKEQKEREKREHEVREQREREQKRRQEREKERHNDIQPVSLPAPLFTPGARNFAFSSAPPPTEGIAAISRPADGLKDKAHRSYLPPRKSATPTCDVSTDLSSVVQHPIRVTRY